MENILKDNSHCASHSNHSMGEDIKFFDNSKDKQNEKVSIIAYIYIYKLIKKA